jgi:hypothetical protein
MDEDTKYIIKSLTENLAAITEKQAIILELLASKLPDISDAEKGKLRESAKMNEENAKKLASILENTLDEVFLVFIARRWRWRGFSVSPEGLPSADYAFVRFLWNVVG